ncbi:hypothetical protein K438DRAFT_1612814, partial [Mycena galopus ATCC 62051]
MQSERITNPNGAERLDRIMAKIDIGDTITPEQRMQVVEVLRRYGDCYAEDVKVLPVNFVTHKLHVEADAQLPTKVAQPPLTEPQKIWYYDMLDQMEAGGILARVHSDYVKCVSPTKLVPK